MEEVNFVAESFKFMFLGMSVVFIFLLVLIEVMKLQAKIVTKYFPDEEPVAPVTRSSQDEEQKRVAAIIGAVSEFRKNKQNKV
jgi:oxaloacetate decarboxylase gamma subunit